MKRRIAVVASMACILLFSQIAKAQYDYDFSTSQKDIDDQLTKEKESGALSLWKIAQWTNYLILNKHRFTTNLGDFGFDYYEKYTTSGKKYGIIKLPKDTITKAKFEIISGAYECGVVVSTTDKTGIVDTTGKLAVPIEFDNVKSFDFKTGYVKRNGKLALISFSGKLLTGFLFDMASEFSDGVCQVVINGKAGFIDRNGQYLIQPQYTGLTDFFYGFAVSGKEQWKQISKEEAIVGRNKTVGVNLGYSYTRLTIINKKGVKIYIGDENDDDVSICSNGLAVISKEVRSNGRTLLQEQLIDNEGKALIPYNKGLWVIAITKDWVIVKSSGTNGIGITNLKGIEILKPTLYNITGLVFRGNELAKAYFDEENFMYIDKSGKCVNYDGIACPTKD
ncbi:WG repeat-containing protein [Parasediminibacterium sp. JCM 36343]|uniref:WG repeat-containing protein n=1 Tax=Parasediminibacterium sp. JCM 36343 TaxID=3374279 RepID=UPI00397C3B02